MTRIMSHPPGLVKPVVKGAAKPNPTATMVLGYTKAVDGIRGSPTLNPYPVNETPDDEWLKVWLQKARDGDSSPSRASDTFEALRSFSRLCEQYGLPSTARREVLLSVMSGMEADAPLPSLTQAAGNPPARPGVLAVEPCFDSSETKARSASDPGLGSFEVAKQAASSGSYDSSITSFDLEFARMTAY